MIIERFKGANEKTQLTAIVLFLFASLAVVSYMYSVQRGVVVAINKANNKNFSSLTSELRSLEALEKKNQASVITESIVKEIPQ